jgi:hypothetical protein
MQKAKIKLSILLRAALVIKLTPPSLTYTENGSVNIFWW